MARRRTSPKERDPRLPPPSTTLRGKYKGQTYEVKVVEGGFDYQGTHYRFLSTVARTITGYRTNGFRFFGLTSKTSQRDPLPVETANHC